MEPWSILVLLNNRLFSDCQYLFLIQTNHTFKISENFEIFEPKNSKNAKIKSLKKGYPKLLCHLNWEFCIAPFTQILIELSNSLEIGFLEWKFSITKIFVQRLKDWPLTLIYYISPEINQKGLSPISEYLEGFLGIKSEFEPGIRGVVLPEIHIRHFIKRKAKFFSFGNIFYWMAFICFTFRFTYTHSNYLPLT